jgi:hypothetical protein
MKEETYLSHCSIQQWLREVHRIMVIVDFYKIDCKEEGEEIRFKVTVTFPVSFKTLSTHLDFQLSDFKTYEEALETGLFNTLTLMK